ncbi:MAG TPA: hypothetical protein PKA30_13440 [Accumulibacter sp.]|uniref:hypothetical protein n=1 Tax=Accumulibacter sp. TaxID=2053492 RepID=UPI002CBFEF20|nr:hypothetical protein [Accumulibacter sp.]HMV06540.1 hypothetical protein [Accumulibacter sp.]HMW81752.1 hypothetical protein [Accumulibacter sp.]
MAAEIGNGASLAKSIVEPAVAAREGYAGGERRDAGGHDAGSYHAAGLDMQRVEFDARYRLASGWPLRRARQCLTERRPQGVRAPSPGGSA